MKNTLKRPCKNNCVSRKAYTVIFVVRNEFRRMDEKRAR